MVDTKSTWPACHSVVHRFERSDGLLAELSSHAFWGLARVTIRPGQPDRRLRRYRHRIGNAPGELRFRDTERRLAERPPITV